ncbi:hypothetical protein [Rhodanobacter sp. C01]|uniref:hypothetical protein n=1 Tax=Rhodanobacter sp. C01 TaxID=1945856 RepID=UPI0011158C2C|nr:hypothetical protein [Rhodanobacter sp. C01]
MIFQPLKRSDRCKQLQSIESVENPGQANPGSRKSQGHLNAANSAQTSRAITDVAVASSPAITMVDQYCETGGYMRHVVKLVMFPIWSLIGGIVFIIFGGIAVIDYLADSGKS